MIPELDLPAERIVAVPAPFIRRISAVLIDLILLYWIILIPFERIIAGMIPSGISYSDAFLYLQQNPALLDLMLIVIGIFSLLSWLYFSILEYKLGATAGKLLMRIRVSGQKKDESPTLPQSILRNMIIIFLYIFWPVVVIDALVALFNHHRQRATEMFSRTRTIYTQQI